MKVCVSVHGRFHAFELARGLHQRGALSRLLTTYPGFVARGLIGADLPVRSAWWLEARRRMSRGGLDQVKLARDFACFAAARLPRDADLLVGWSGATLEAIEPAHALGMKVVIERGSTHIEHQTEVLRRAYAEHEFEFDETPAAIIERELAEYEAADAIAVPSTFCAETFVARGVDRSKLLINPYGVDLTQFASQGARTYEKAKPRVLFVGRVGIRKGAIALSRSFATFPEDVEYHFVGPVDSASSWLLNLANYEDMHFRGPVPAAELPNEYAAADIFCLPSLEEGLPLVLLQAMASGLPVVVTPECGAADILTDGVEGFIVPSGDHKALSEAIRQLVAVPARRAEMGAAARARVEAGWSWDDYAERAVANYRKLLA